MFSLHGMIGTVLASWLATRCCASVLTMRGNEATSAAMASCFAICTLWTSISLISIGFTAGCGRRSHGRHVTKLVVTDMFPLEFVMPAYAKPVLGAALSINSLPAYREWLVSRQRDLELQDFFRAEALEGDWRGVADRVKQLLDGFKGRLGIHGPFWGFKIDSHDPLVRKAVATRLLQALEAAEYVGASQMVVHSPYTTWDHNNLDLYSGNREAVVERVQLSICRMSSAGPSRSAARSSSRILRTRTRTNECASPGHWTARTFASHSIPGMPFTRTVRPVRRRSITTSMPRATC